MINKLLAESGCGLGHYVCCYNEAMVTVGIDEVGRGCWAGPLVAGAVILDEPIAELRDSKTLSARQRERLAREIEQTAAAIGIGWVEAWEIDAIGLTQAVTLAMERALHQIRLPFDAIIIDGNYGYLSDYLEATTLVGADDIEPAVSAASILAKVARDEHLQTVLQQQFPDYGFAKHVGYGTKLHLEMLQKHGVSSEHRQSFRPIQALLAAGS